MTPVNNGADPEPLVLVVDDEPGILDFVELGLHAEGYRVTTTTSGGAALEVIRRERPDAVILDVGLPDVDGFSVVRSIRAETDVPIVMLTARGDVEDRVRGLELGADDYIAKPFHFEELVARLRAHLRRRLPRDEVVRLADVELHPRTHAVTRAGRPISLTPREYELLELFLRHPDEVLSKHTILDRLWGYDFDDNLVEVYVGYLRRKLGDPPLVETLRGTGYVMRASAA
jgi:two-component system response regulator MprA